MKAIQDILLQVPNEILSFWNVASFEMFGYRENPNVQFLEDVKGHLLYTYRYNPAILWRYLIIITESEEKLYYWNKGWIYEDKMLRIIKLKAFL